MRVLKWTAVGMRDKGIGEYVELREYRELEAALRGLLTTVEHMRAPQTVADVGLLILKFEPVMQAARTALNRGVEHG